MHCYHGNKSQVREDVMLLYVEIVPAANTPVNLVTQEQNIMSQGLFN